MPASHSSASYLVVDVETITDPLLPSPPLDGLPSAPHHQIVALGVCWFDRNHKVKKLGIIGDGKSESETLEDFVRFFDGRQPDIVTWNGRGFDMPVIATRCFKHGIPFHVYYESRGFHYRFTTEQHLDLMDFLSDFGASRPARLDTIARLIGLPGKSAVEGRDVSPLIHAGKLAEVQGYCLSDVLQISAVFLRTQLIRGLLSREEYQASIDALLTAAEGHPLLAPLVGTIDRPTLRLGPA